MWFCVWLKPYSSTHVTPTVYLKFHSMHCSVLRNIRHSQRPIKSTNFHKFSNPFSKASAQKSSHKFFAIDHFRQFNSVDQTTWIYLPWKTNWNYSWLFKVFTKCWAFVQLSRIGWMANFYFHCLRLSCWTLKQLHFSFLKPARSWIMAWHFQEFLWWRLRRYISLSMWSGCQKSWNWLKIVKNSSITVR